MASGGMASAAPGTLGAVLVRGLSLPHQAPLLRVEITAQTSVLDLLARLCAVALVRARHRAHLRANVLLPPPRLSVCDESPMTPAPSPAAALLALALQDSRPGMEESNPRLCFQGKWLEPGAIIAELVARGLLLLPAARAAGIAEQAASCVFVAEDQAAGATTLSASVGFRKLDLVLFLQDRAAWDLKHGTAPPRPPAAVPDGNGVARDTAAAPALAAARPTSPATAGETAKKRRRTEGNCGGSSAEGGA